LGARAIPVPNSIDLFFLKEEVKWKMEMEISMSMPTSVPTGIVGLKGFKLN
jgi:hypothetical protein